MLPHVSRLQDLILWRWQYTSNWCTDSVQSYQNFSWISYQSWNTDPKVHMEMNLKDSIHSHEELCWRTQAFWLQNFLWSSSNQNSEVQEKGQMEGCSAGGWGVRAWFHGRWDGSVRHCRRLVGTRVQAWLTGPTSANTEFMRKAV